MEPLQLGHGGAFHRLKPAPEEWTSERVAAAGDVKQPRVSQRLVFQPLLDADDGVAVRGLHDQLVAAGWAGQIAGLIEAANDVLRPERHHRQLFADHLKKVLVLDVLHSLNRSVHPLEVRAKFGPAVPEGAVQDGPPEFLGRAAVPDLLDGGLTHVADRAGDPILAAEIGLAPVAAAAEDFKPLEGLCAEEPFAVSGASGYPSMNRGSPDLGRAVKKPTSDPLCLSSKDGGAVGQ